MCDVYGEEWFGPKTFDKWAKHGVDTSSLSRKDSL